MTFPSLKDWIFSTKSFAAGALALAVAFTLDLQHPSWALTTVYITAQPFAGATRAKAIWRLTGTFAAGAFAVAVVPNFVNAPPLLCMVFAIWIAACLMLSLLDPTPRSYAFMLSGYTAAIIGFPSVDAPEAIFDTAVSRCEEISLGILCAWLVHGVLFPRPGVPLLRQRLTAWMDGVARFGAASLRRPLDRGTFASERRRMARDGAALDALFQQVRYEMPNKAALLHLPKLHERARQIPALITFAADRARLLREESPEALAAIQPLLNDTAQWLADTARMAKGDAAGITARRLLDRLQRARDTAHVRATWAGVLQEGIVARVTEMVEHWRECVALGARMLADESADAPAPARSVRAPGHTDPLLLALSGAATVLGILIGSFFWIATGWANGSSVPLWAAIPACIYAQHDDPAPAAARFMIGAALAILASSLLLFGVLPAVDGFPLLLTVLAMLYLPVGALQSVPAYSGVATATLVITPTMLGLQETYSADVASFADSSAAILLGLGLSLAVTRLMRSVGIAWRVQRLAAADRRDLLRLVEGQPDQLQRILAVMLDRFEALAARLDAVDERTISVEELADMRAALNVLRLRERLDALAPDLRRLIADALAALRTELRGRGSAAETLARIDAAVTAGLMAQGRQARDVALSMAGLRLARFPNAASPLLLTQKQNTRSLTA